VGLFLELLYYFIHLHICIVPVPCSFWKSGILILPVLLFFYHKCYEYIWGCFLHMNVHTIVTNEYILSMKDSCFKGVDKMGGGGG
jgi:hypothetical protein